MRIDPGNLARLGGIAWGVSFVAARLLLEEPGLNVGTRALLAFGPTIPFAGMLIGAVGILREVDEMERRIQVEGLAVAFGLATMLVATLALAQRAGLAKYEDFSFVHILPMMFIFYLGGTLLARRRYTSCETE